MNAKRIVMALLLALLVSGLCTFVLARRVMLRAAGRPLTRPYATVNKAVSPGEILKAESLSLVDWPVSITLQGAYDHIEEVAGRATVYPISPGQPILILPPQARE